MKWLKENWYALLVFLVCVSVSFTIGLACSQAKRDLMARKHELQNKIAHLPPGAKSEYIHSGFGDSVIFYNANGQYLFSGTVAEIEASEARP